MNFNEALYGRFDPACLRNNTQVRVYMTHAALTSDNIIASRLACREQVDNRVYVSIQLAFSQKERLPTLSTTLHTVAEQQCHNL